MNETDIYDPKLGHDGDFTPEEWKRLIEQQEENQKEDREKKQEEGLTNQNNDQPEYAPPQDNPEYPLLKDVYGSKELKEDLEEVVLNCAYEDLYKEMQTRPYKTALFTGEPGNGKTFSAKAIRNELANNYRINVMWAPYNIGEQGTAYINMSSKNIQKFFDGVIEATEHGYKSLVFFDECDVVLGKRGQGSHKEDDKLANTINKNLQYINDEVDGVYVIMATNFPEAMDNASVRSGRVDKQIYFPKPDEQTRYFVFKDKTAEYNKKMRQEYGDDLFKKMNYKKLAQESDGLSMSEITSIYDNAIRSKVYQVITDKTSDYRVGEKDILQEIEKVKGDKGHYDKGIGFR